jgi:polyisoprenoid-binding protein YceI
MPYECSEFLQRIVREGFMSDYGVLTIKTLRHSTLFPLLALAACQATPPAEHTAAPAPGARVEAQLAVGAQRYAVQSAQSQIRLLVYRAGPLARFGHNHVIVGPVRGEVWAGRTSEQSGFLLEIPVEALSVDSAAARAEEGEEFAAQVSVEARQGTREHMLGEDVLDAPRYPVIRVESASLTGPRWNPSVVARATLRGATRELKFPAAVVEQGDRLTVIASFALRQSDFGIEPYSALGGGLRVTDEIRVRIRVEAHRVDRAG